MNLEWCGNPWGLFVALIGILVIALRDSFGWGNVGTIVGIIIMVGGLLFWSRTGRGTCKI